MNILRSVTSRLRKLVTYIATFGVLCTVGAQGVWASSPTWLTSGVPTLQKLTELPANTPPFASGTDCTKYAYQPAGFDQPVEACTYPFALGTLTTSGRLVIGSNRTAPRMLYGNVPNTRFLAVNGTDYALLASLEYRTTLRVYKPGSLSMKDVVYVPASNIEPYYYVNKQPDFVLKDTAGNPLYFDRVAIGFSANGKWMVINNLNNGIWRYNTETWEGKLFAPSPAVGATSAYIGPGSPSFAISNDGKYAAIVNASPDGASPSLEVYDTETCSDQSMATLSSRKYCQSKDVWNGLVNKKQVDGGVKSVAAGVVRPLSVRFRTNETISFNAVYNYQNGSAYKAATYTITVAGTQVHQLGLLGMGDSYISGEGLFSYRSGTDTDDNKCHLSTASYPLTLGGKYFDTFNSVACSGAKSTDINSYEPNKYLGQTETKILAENRDIVNIINNFQPGYLNQNEFATKYTPEAVLVSVGGNNVHFADIVSTCVAPNPTAPSTCYSSYKERAELINSINAEYSNLVETYTSIRNNANGARVYVVGYPQIVKPNGDCGENVKLDPAETVFATQLIAYLDSVIAAAASTAGVQYVDTQHAFDGFRLCEAEKGVAAMNGATAGDDIGAGMFKIIGNESYHPTKLGHALLAKAIDEATQNLTLPMPNPRAFSQPTFSESTDMLQSVPKTSEPLNVIKYDDTVFTDSLLQRGDIKQAAAFGSGLQLQPGSTYTIVIHSEPRTLATGTVNSDGNVIASYTIPADMPAGLHTLHLYAKNMAGETIDVPHIVYVAASPDDYDGDGLPNAANMCLVFPLSGVDYDEDSIDDACDPDITQQPPHPAEPESGSASGNDSNDGNDGTTTPPDPSDGNDDTSSGTTSGTGDTPPTDDSSTPPEASGNGSTTPPNENQQPTPPASGDTTSNPVKPDDTTQTTSGATNTSGASAETGVTTPASSTTTQIDTQTPVQQTQPTTIAATSPSNIYTQQLATEQFEPSAGPQPSAETSPTTLTQPQVLHSAVLTPPKNSTQATTSHRLTAIWLLTAAAIACGSTTVIWLRHKNQSSQ